MTYENPGSLHELVDIYGFDTDILVKNARGDLQPAVLGPYVNDFEEFCKAHDRVASNIPKQIGYLAVAIDRAGNLKRPVHDHLPAWADM